VNPVLLSPQFRRALLLTADNQDACAHDTGRSVQITYLISKHKEIYYSRRQNLNQHYTKKIIMEFYVKLALQFTVLTAMQIFHYLIFA